MIRLRSTITSGLLTLALCLAILAMVLVKNDVQAVQADAAGQPIVTAVDNTVFLQLTDAPPVRDITQQRFAPLESVQ